MPLPAATVTPLTLTPLGLGGGSSVSLPWIDVTDDAYGAVGDGGNDDTSAFQAAVAAAAVEGGAVCVPTGIYKITSPIVVPSNVVVFGEGWGSVVKGASGANPIFDLQDPTNGTVQGVGLLNLKIDGTSIATGLTGLRSVKWVVGGTTDAARNNWAQGVCFTNCAVGARMVNDQGFAFYSCRFDSNGTGLYAADNSQLSLVSQCDFRANTIAGTNLESTAAVIGGTPDRIYGWKFERCHWEVNTGYGVILDGATYNTFDTCKWEQNANTGILSRDTNSGFRPDGNVFVNCLFNGLGGVFDVDLVKGNQTFFLGGVWNAGSNGVRVGASVVHTVFMHVALNCTFTDSSSSTTVLTHNGGTILNRWRGGPQFDTDNGLKLADDSATSSKGLVFGSASDTALYRSAAGILRLANTLYVEKGSSQLGIRLAGGSNELAQIGNIAGVTEIQFGVNGLSAPEIRSQAGKLGFFNTTPVSQPAANPDTSGATLANLEIEVNQLKATLRSLGLLAP